jgi:hypothetical protein
VALAMDCRVGSRHLAGGARPTPDRASGDLVPLIRVAKAVAASHVGAGGICKSCLEDLARLAPVPCESARWAVAVLEAYDFPVAAVGAGVEK